MAEDVRYYFKPGDFVRSAYQPTAFCIYTDIVSLETQWTRNCRLFLRMNPSKCFKKEDGKFDFKPALEVAKKGEWLTDVTTDHYENSITMRLTPEEKEKALAIIKENGYSWNEETLELVELSTGEVIHRIVFPKNEYNGEIIKPSRANAKEFLPKATSYSSYAPPMYNRNDDHSRMTIYQEWYGDDYGDYYGD